MHIFTAYEVCNELELSPMFPFSSLFPASNARIPRPFDLAGYSFFEARSSEALAESLSLEVRALQAELHHTQRVLSGYSTVLERCEVRGNTQVWVHTLLVLVIGFLVIFWLGNLASKQFGRPVQSRLVTPVDRVTQAHLQKKLRLSQ